MSKGHNPFESLKAIRSDLPRGKSEQGQPDGTDSSIQTGGEDRVGRAPYNFVRMPNEDEMMGCLADSPPPSHAIYCPALRSGYIDLRIAALTDFYIRGTWLLKDYPGKNIREQERPFEIACKLRLPGSSLRGMIRELVEILAYSPLDPINKSRFAYRTIGSSANPKSPAFEPCAPRYNQLMRGVQAGYLFKQKVKKTGSEEWLIRSAKRMPANNQQIYKFEESRTDLREPVYFSTPRASGNSKQRFLIVDLCTSGATATTAMPHKGWLVCSGPIQGRRYQWIINEPDSTKPPLRIPTTDFEKHKEAELTGWIEEAIEDPLYRSDGIPVFYVQAAGPITVYFGKTFYFRLPYTYTTHDFNRSARYERDCAQVDLARAIFGYASSNVGGKLCKGQRSRVYFEDAFELERTDLIPTEVVLGEPRASTFQHYIEQRSERATEAKHWDTEDAKLRGFKIYWHRPGAVIGKPTGNNKSVVSTFLRVRSGARFAARIRYDNLSDVELGAVLTALELPGDCAHRLGTGKPLGLGSFQIVTKLVQICRTQRYGSFIGGSGSVLECGVIEKPTECSQNFKLAFSDWLFERLKIGKATSDVWSDVLCPRRLLDLRHMITYKGTPMSQPEWEHATRYLELGVIPGYNIKHAGGIEQSYNEYQQVGWPDPPIERRRRPLPPAASVFKFGEVIPKTKRPPFEKS